MPAARSGWDPIVVPLDGSPFAEHALGYAGAIAGAVGARLRLVLVHELPPPPGTPDAVKLYASVEVAVRKSQRAYLRETAHRLRDRWKVQVTALSPDGPVGPALLRYLNEMEPGLVVMSTHGRGSIGRALLGSVADRVVREAKAPVLLVRAPSEGWTPSDILVPLDGSGLAEAALGPAVDLARAAGGRLTLVQVVVPVSSVTDPPMSFSGSDERLTDLRRREAQDYLDGVADRIREQGVTASAAAVVAGSPAGALIDLAGGGHVSLVVMASHGRGGMRRLALGSVADKMVRAASAPVLVIRQPPRAPRRR